MYCQEKEVRNLINTWAQIAIQQVTLGFDKISS